MDPTAIKAKPDCRSGSNNTELPEARVNAKVNPDGTKELSSNGPHGSHSRDKGKTGQAQVQTEVVAIGDVPSADTSKSSGETSKKPVDVVVLPKDKQYPTKSQPYLLDAQQKQPGPRASWSQVLKEGRAANHSANQKESHTQVMKLQFFEPKMENNRIVVHPPEEIGRQGCLEWQNCLVGYFIEKKLPFTTVSYLAHKMWDSLGLLEVLAKDNGFYYFKFMNDESRTKIFESGPWLLSGRPLILQKWQPNLLLTKENHSIIPLWVKLHNIPLQFWNEKGLSYIASAVGKPLYADTPTSKKQRINFARICVEVSARNPLIEAFDLNVDINGMVETVEIKVEYQWKPKMCFTCKVFGHNESSCPKIMSKTRNNVEEQAAVHFLSIDQPALCLDKGKAVASVVLDTETVETNKKRVADNHLVPGNEIEGYPQVDSQVTEITVKQVAPPQQDTGRITSKNKYADLSLEGGEIIVDLATESQPSTSICNEVTKEKERTNGNKHPLGSKKKKVKKKDHEMGKSKVTEHLILRKVLPPQ